MDVNAAARDFNASPGTALASSSPPQTDDVGIRIRRQSVRSPRSHVPDKYHAQSTSRVKEPVPQPQLQPRASRMSLFSLFSKPKVEKARGYAEQGLTAPSTLNLKQSNASKLKVVGRSEQDDVVGELHPRTASALSFRNHIIRPASRASNRIPVPAAPSQKGVHFEAPPLFQAYPQSIKHGMLQVSMMTAETVLQKSKNRKAGGLALEAMPRGSTEGSGSIETRRTAKTTFRHIANGSITHVEIPKKIFVLVTSGYLLQYAESGPSNRLPERVLQLGKESAAFACDLIPGKHYVLQISQAVDQQGVLIANSGSIFSKLGLRNAAARRMTANFLLVMPNAAEMNSWMTAIREEIEALGGSKARPDVTVRPQTRGSTDELEELAKSPSRSHRYQVRRDPSKVSLVSSPQSEPTNILPPPPRIRNDDERSETGTIDGIEEEAEQLGEESRNSPAKTQREPDAQSVRSSIAMSMDQQRLDSLRSSQRISHSTVATTVGTSRSNSLCGSPPSEDSTKGTSESSTESTEPRSQYRTLSSYASAVARRRSVMPLLSKKEKPLPALNVPAPFNRHSAVDADTNSPLPIMASPRKLAVAASEPNLRAVADARAKHDSKMPTTPMLAEESERPLSIVGDLPSPLALASERSPNERISSLMHVATAPLSGHRGITPRASMRSSESVKSARKQSMQPFSLPLKINPSTPENRPPIRHEDRGSFNNVDEGSGDPVVHTLTAKIDPSRSPWASSRAPTSPQPDVPSRNPTRTQSARLTLFPSHAPPSPPLQSPAIVEPIKQNSSPVAPTPAPAQPHGTTLKRPTSMQVRSDPAPFLRGVRIRTSTYGPSTAQSGRSFTAPIRSLKPSRPSPHIAAKSYAPPSPTDPFTISSATFDIPDVPEEAADKATPLPERTLSPPPVGPPSRNTNSRKQRTRASLPELDLGIPVVGLGPPAPPPQSPLPPPPPASRPTGPMPGATGLGIRV